MSFDFFGEGIAEAPKVIFTPDEENFFKAKLPFLDPKSKGSIEVGTAVSFIKFSGLPPLTQKKILENLKIIGKSSVDYTDMKKIFRGIAMAQNKIEPSAVNINANIKTKMPVFYDDDDDDQEQQQPEQKEVRKVVQKKQEKVQRREVPKQVPAQRPVNQKPPQVPSPKVQEQRGNQITQNPQFKKFEEIWKSLPTKGYLVAGNEVKKAFGNSSNRKQLAKAWKLCSSSEKGYLTKGELFVFLHLIKQAKGQIPEALNPKMKEIIAKIDKGKVRTETKLSRDFEVGSSQMFQNFNKSQAFDPIKNKSNVNLNVLEKSQNVQNEKVEKLQTSLEAFSNFQQKDRKKIESIEAKAENQAVIAQNILNKFEILNKEAENSRTLLSQTQQFLNRVSDRNTLVREKIDFFKQNQDNLTDRLNQTCVKMRDLIVKQAEFIDELLGEMQNEGQMNKERVTILENYTESMNEQINMKMSSRVKRSKINSKPNIDQPSSKESIQQKKYIKRIESNEQLPEKQPEEENHRFEEKQVPIKKQPDVFRPSSQSILQSSQQVEENPKQSIQNERVQEQSIQPDSEADLAKRLHSKRVYTIQMINCITPITRQQYPIIVQKITHMTENQLDGLYAQLYKKYEQKMKQQNEKIENQQVRPITNDQFSSNNFPQVNSKPSQSNKEDFFGK